MNKAIVSLLAAVSVSAIFCVTSAKNTACFNANGEIAQVFCDGRDITGRLPNRANVNKCDCIQLDICKNITIRAKGVRDGGQSRPGIGLCQTSRPTPYRDWTCAKSKKVKRWKSQTMNYRSWRPAEETKKVTKRCHSVKELPCKSKMFWNEGVDAQSVDCILFQCGDQCQSCKMTGPGKCDPGMCNQGSDVHSQTKETKCNRRCRVDWLAWGRRDSPTATGEGYMKITDLSTVPESTETFRANKPGYYFALVDMDRCAFINKTYIDWTYRAYRAVGFPTGASYVRQMATNTSATNLMGVELAVGGLNNTMIIANYPPNTYETSFAPAASVYRFGTGVRDLPIPYNRNCSISAIFTGFQYGMTNLEIKVNIPATITDPNEGC